MRFVLRPKATGASGGMTVGLGKENVLNEAETEAAYALYVLVSPKKKCPRLFRVDKKEAEQLLKEMEGGLL